MEKKFRPLINGIYARPEFESIKNWKVSEKIDGMNIRICFDRSKGEITFKGRTSKALLPPELMKYLYDTFPYEKVESVFSESNYAILFGEGYGGSIQAARYYSEKMSFALFDIFCSGLWLDRDSVKDVADQLEITTAPELGNIWRIEDIVEFVKGRPKSEIAQKEHEMEGIVARAHPVMMFRRGGPIMFKLKCRDFYNGESNG